VGTAVLKKLKGAKRIGEKKMQFGAKKLVEGGADGKKGERICQVAMGRFWKPAAQQKRKKGREECCGRGKSSGNTRHSGGARGHAEQRRMKKTSVGVFSCE